MARDIQRVTLARYHIPNNHNRKDSRCHIVNRTDYKSQATAATPTHQTSDLPAVLRAKAAELRRFSSEQAASALEYAADLVEASLVEQSSRLLRISEAAQLVSRHRDTISNAVSDGRLTNYGTKHRPAVRFGELTQAFPPRDLAERRSVSYDDRADARSHLETRRGGLI